jgi:hypothetical protein
MLPTYQIYAATSAAVVPSITPAESVRRSAANIPGYGPTDVFFPQSWVGQWKVQRQVSFGEINKNNSDDSSSPFITLKDYTVRFVTSVEDGKVVADRGYNQANLEAVVTHERPPSYEWMSSNPNDLHLIWPDGYRKDIKVTQRATDTTRIAQGRLWSSEVQRVTTDNGKQNIPSIPSIAARRVVTQYRWEPPTTNDPLSSINVVQALETIYDLGGNNDPLQTGPTTLSNTYKILSKSRIVMQKVNGNEQR